MDEIGLKAFDRWEGILDTRRRVGNLLNFSCRHSLNPPPQPPQMIGKTAKTLRRRWCTALTSTPESGRTVVTRVSAWSRKDTQACKSKWCPVIFLSKKWQPLVCVHPFDNQLCIPMSFLLVFSFYIGKFISASWYQLPPSVPSYFFCYAISISTIVFYQLNLFIVW